MNVKAEDVKQFATMKVKGSKMQVGENLHLRVSSSGRVTYTARYTDQNKKRKEKTLAEYGEITLSRARIMALDLKEKKPANTGKNKTVGDVYMLLLDDKKDQLEKGEITQKTHDNYVRYKDRISSIYKMQIDQVEPLDIKNCLKESKEQASTCNKVFSMVNQIFAMAYNLGFITNDPTYRLESKKDAGGPENMREKALTLEEIETAFGYLRLHVNRKVYLACALLVIFGCRKNELIKAKKSAFDLGKGIWTTKKKKNVRKRNAKEN